READLLGIEYEYAAGYDPQAFVDFFERIASQRKNPNFVARAFDSHPMNQDRIHRAQKEIATMLPAHDQYIVNTSEFDEMKAHLLERFNARLALTADSSSDKPVLRRRENDGAAPPDTGGTDDRPKLERRTTPDSRPAETKPAPDDAASTAPPTPPNSNTEDPPTLKRRPLPESQPPEPKPEPDQFFQR